MSTIKLIDTKEIIGNMYGNDIEIYPISDAHIGSKQFNEKAFKTLLDHIKAEPYRFVVLVGDLIDNGTRSSVTSPFESTMHPNEQRKYVADLLTPIKERILGAVSGNHERRTGKDSGLDAMQLIMERLELEHLYRENIAFIKVDLNKRRHSQVRSPKYCIGITHGAGGGTTLGAGLSKAEPFAIALGVDLLITGHTHKPVASTTTRFEPKLEAGAMMKRDVKILTSSGFLDWEGYPAQKMLRPVSIAPNHAVLNSVDHAIKLVQY